MKVKPEECLVLEDSVAGLKAAKSAGMKCIVCPDKFSKIDIKEFKTADKIVKSLKDVNLGTAHSPELFFDILSSQGFCLLKNL